MIQWRILSLSVLCILLACNSQTRDQQEGRTSGALTGPLVVSSNWPRCTDLVSWAEDIWRIEELNNASETRRAIALFNWVRLFNQVCMGGPSQMVEGLPGEEAYVQDPHKGLFVYGWGYCDTHSRVMEALWQEYKGDSTACYRVCCKNEKGGYHTMYRLRADGSYQAYDARFAFYLLEKDSPDARVLDWHEVGVDSNVTMNERFTNRQPVFWENPTAHREYIIKIEPTYWELESEWSAAGKPAYQMFANPKHKFGTRYHDMNWRLARGMKIERYWNNSARQFYRPIWHMNRKSRPRFLPSGRFHSFHESRLDSIYKRLDPNWNYTRPYHMTIPAGEGYPKGAVGDRALPQAWGKVTYAAPLDGDGWADLLASNANLVHERTAPRLRPADKDLPAEAVFDFYCPYILTEGTFTGSLAAGKGDKVALELRTLAPKADNLNQPDRWSEWTELASGPGTFEKTLGFEQYEQKQNTVHGKYRFQLRLSAFSPEAPSRVGLNELSFTCFFENGIMAIPRLAAGENTITFEVADQSSLAGSVTVTYGWETADGTEKTHSTILRPEQFAGNQASYTLDTPGLVRCRSLAIEY